jgi:hypothetical protein
MTLQTQAGEAAECSTAIVITEHTNSDRDDSHGHAGHVGSSRRDSATDGEEFASTQRSGHITNKLPITQFSVSKRPPVSSHFPPSRSTKPNAIVHSNQPIKAHNTPLTTRSLGQKSDSLQPMHKLSTGGAVHQLLAARSSRRNKLVQNTEDTPVTPRVGTRCPPVRVGDFFRVFPFNEATKKCSLGNLDVKTVVRECRQMYKERLKVTKRQNQPDLAGQDYMTTPKVMDVELLWGPLLGDAPTH